LKALFWCFHLYIVIWKFRVKFPAHVLSTCLCFLVAWQTEAGGMEPLYSFDASYETSWRLNAQDKSLND